MSHTQSAFLFMICTFRAIDINGLIGIIGGYIGLFLGYSFLQIPEFLRQGVAQYQTCKATKLDQRKIEAPIHMVNRSPSGTLKKYVDSKHGLPKEQRMDEDLRWTKDMINTLVNRIKRIEDGLS